MKKREQGILTVEASIVLTLFMLFVLFIFSFARIYSAQNIVSHATIQTSDDMALESYLRENARDDKAQDVVYLASRLTGSTTLCEDNFKSLQVTDIPSLAREKFIAAISSSEYEADEILKKFGVKDGISGIDFSASSLDNQKENVIVSVSYTLKVQFPIFGGNEISVTKTSKSKTFGKVLNELSVVPNDPLMGSAAGSGNYPDGQVVQISASPHYGYKFVKWEDGNTNNPRSVTVNGAQKFTAIFAEDGFGVTMECNPTDAGQLSGASRYEYMSSATISQTANPGYTFKNWTIFSHRDKTTHTETAQSVSRTMDQSYTFTANYNPNPYDISVESQGCSADVTVTETDNSSNRGKKITVLYGSRVTLSAPDVYDYIFKGWKKKNDSAFISTNKSVTINIPPNNTTYVAVYEEVPYYTVTLNMNGGTLLGVRTNYQVKSGRASDTLQRPIYQGHEFLGWDCSVGGNYSVGSSVTNVQSNITLTAKWSNSCNHVWGTCGVTHTSGDGKAHQLDKHSTIAGHTKTFTCEVCIKCGALANGPCYCVVGNPSCSRTHLCMDGNCWKLWKDMPVRRIHDELGQ